MKKQIVLFIVAVAFILAITGASSAVTQVDTNSPQYTVGHKVTEQALADSKLKLNQSNENLVITTASTVKLNNKTTEDTVQAIVDSTKNLNGKQQITHGSGNLLTINDPNGPIWIAFVSDSANGLMVKKFSVSKSGTITSTTTVNIGTTQSTADFQKAIAALGSNGFAIANIANLWKAGAPADLMALTFTNGNINQGTISNYAATKTFALKYTSSNGSMSGSNYIITTAGGLDDDTAFYGVFQMNDIVFSIPGPAGQTAFINYNGTSPNRSGKLALMEVNDLTSQFGTVNAGTLSEIKFNLWLLNKLQTNHQNDLFSVLAFKTVNENNIQYLWYDPSAGYGNGIDEEYIYSLTDVAGGWTGVPTVIPITDYDGMFALGQDAFNYAFKTQHLFTINDLANGRVALSVAPYYVNYLGTRSLVGFIDGVVRAANTELVLAGLPNAQGFTIDNILSIRNSWFWGMTSIQTFFMFVDPTSSQNYAQHRGENLAMNYLTIKSVRSTYTYKDGSYDATRTSADISPKLIEKGNFLGSFIIPAPAGLTYAWSAGASYSYLRTIARVGCICSTREYDLSMILQGQFPLGSNERYILTVLTNPGETNRQISGRTTAWGVSPGQGTYYSVGESADSAYQLIVTIWNDVTQTGRSLLIGYDGTPIENAMANDGYTIFKQENDLFWHLDHGWVDEQDVIASSISTAKILSNMNQDFLISMNSAGLDPIRYMLNYVPPTTSINTHSGLFTEDIIVTLNAEPGTTIYYTLDGTTPTTESLVYNGSISITRTTTLQYMVVHGPYFSPIYMETYTIDKAPAEPSNPTNPTTPSNPTNPATPGTVITDTMAGITGAIMSIANVITETTTPNTVPNEIAPGLPGTNNPTNNSASSPLGIIIGVILLAVAVLFAYLGRNTIAAFFGREKS